MLHKRQIAILEMLLNAEETMTAKEFALSADVSERTIKSDITDINTVIAPFSVKIQSKARVGYWLEYQDEKAKQELNNFVYSTTQDDTPIYRYERIQYLIRKLLVVDYHVKLEDLADELSVSRSVLSADIKEVKRLLNNYRLKVVSRPNHGILIEGDEIDKRLCISDYFLVSKQQNNYLYDSQTKHERKSLKDYASLLLIVQEVTDKYGIVISDALIDNLVFHLSLSLKRCQFYNYVKVNEATLARMQDTVDFKAALELTSRLERLSNLMLPVGETVYYAMHIQSKKTSGQNLLRLEEQTKIHQCIDLMLSEIDNNFALTLSEDEELRYYLYLHIPQMITRLKNHMIIKNPLLQENLRRYFLASKVTHSACVVIERFYDVKVDKNEFGFLVLYFNLAIMKFENNKIIKIGFLSGKGRSESITYFNEIKNILSSKKYLIEQIDGNLEDIEISNYDFMITTDPITEKIEVPIYVIDNNQYLDDIQNKIKQIEQHTIDYDEYFRDEYFIPVLKGNTKDQVMNNFYNILIEKNIINKYPIESQMFAYDELGNKVVHFQDVHRIVRKNVCFIAILEDAILWDDDFVQVLVLTKTKKEKDIELYSLCSILSDFFNDNAKVKQLIKEKSSTQFIDLIKGGNKSD